MRRQDQWVVVMHRGGVVRAAYILEGEYLARQFAAYVEDELGCDATAVRALSPVLELLNWRAYGGGPDDGPPRVYDDADWQARLASKVRSITNVPLPGMPGEEPR